jgi:GNAT superfamily N-acetyltransferase
MLTSNGFSEPNHRTITIRHFTNEDTQKVVKFHEYVTKDAGVFTTGPWNNDLLNIFDVYVKPGGCFIIAEDNNSMIGMGALKILSKDEAEIKRMRVEPTLQRLGIGQKILNFLIIFAQDHGIKRIILDTSVLQKPAQQFYLKNGFIQYGRKHWNDLELMLFEKIL